MTDPVETAQQTGAAVGAGGMLGMTALVGAGIKLWRTVFGSRKDRDAAALAHDAQEQTQAERAADMALRLADRADEQTARHLTDLGTCQEQLRVMRAQADADRAQATADRERLATVESALREHAACGPLIESLRSEIRLARTFVAGAMSTGSSTPPPRDMPTPADVRASMEDDHG
jgi:hypothetical protein